MASRTLAQAPIHLYDHHHHQRNIHNVVFPKTIDHYLCWTSIGGECWRWKNKKEWWNQQQSIAKKLCNDKLWPYLKMTSCCLLLKQRKRKGRDIWFILEWKPSVRNRLRVIFFVASVVQFYFKSLIILANQTSSKKKRGIKQKKCKRHILYGTDRRMTKLNPVCLIVRFLFH